MRFDLDEQQRAFQRAVRDYLSAECPVTRSLAPHNTGAEDLGLWQGLMDLGVGGMVVPEEYGGLGLGLLDLAVVAEVMGRFAAPGPFLEHALATIAITQCGSEAQKARWLPLLAQGKARATIAIAENKGEWAPSAWALDGTDTLNGTKHFVLGAVGADLIVVMLQGGRLGLVDGASPTLRRAAVAATDAGRPLFHLTFQDTPFEAMPEAFGARVFDAGLLLLAADAFGGASHCVSMAVEYAKTREQFGQPIGAFQAVKHQLADMALAIEPSLGLYWYAAYVFDAQPAEVAEAAALAKAHITDLYPKIARRMIEAHGGIGYTWEYGAHVWLKRALFDQAYLGMPSAHRARAADLIGW